MPLPTVDNIKNAVENAQNILDPILKGYYSEPGLLGPEAYPGGFCIVFPLKNPNTSHKYAFRIWHQEIGDIKDRTHEIAKFLESNKAKLPYFVEFKYVSEGLKIDATGEKIDTVRMDWIEGKNLKDYINDVLTSSLTESEKSQKMKQLADKFLKMFRDFHDCKISHGDLQHGNIIIPADETIKVVDYDSVCVPSINGRKSVTRGLTGYQHPLRTQGKANINIDESADYFSELIIYLSIIALAEQPKLWLQNDFMSNEYGLLFSESDFFDISNSALFNDLLEIRNYKINGLLAVLVNYLNKTSYLNLQPFYNTKINLEIQNKSKINTLQVEVTQKEQKIKELDLEKRDLIKQKNTLKKSVAKNRNWAIVSVVLLFVITGILAISLIGKNSNQESEIVSRTTKLEQKVQNLEIENYRLKSDSTYLQNELKKKQREIDGLKNQPLKTVTKEIEVIKYRDRDNPEQAKKIKEQTDKIKKLEEELKTLKQKYL